jgi:hypothetical protein
MSNMDKVLTDNILLSTIEKIATSYHTQPNFCQNKKIAVAISHFLKFQAQAAIKTLTNMDKDIDFDIIESYKKPITIPAKYLEVFSIVYKDFSSNKNRKVENYIVNNKNK